MTRIISIPLQESLSEEEPIELGDITQPQYGHFLEEYELGKTFKHPRGLTIFPAFAQEFATTFMQANPLYLNEHYAQSIGFERMLVSPLMVLNIAFGLSVQND